VFHTDMINATFYLKSFAKMLHFMFFEREVMLNCFEIASEYIGVYLSSYNPQMGCCDN